MPVENCLLSKESVNVSWSLLDDAPISLSQTDQIEFILDELGKRVHSTIDYLLREENEASVEDENRANLAFKGRDHAS